MQEIKKDMFKQIGAFYLYDNQLKTDYLILNQRKERREPKEIQPGAVEWFPTGEYDNSLPFMITSSIDTSAFSRIGKLDKNHWSFKSESVKIMAEACKKEGIPLIRLKEPLTYIKVGTTHMPHYNAYHIYYNETINGDLMGFDLAHAWNIGDTQYSTFRLYEYCNQKPE